MTAKPRIEIRPITDAIPDPKNANLHTERGQNLLEKSMQKRGFFRPIAAAGKDTDNPVIMAGNLTQETAVNLGLNEAIFVYTDGKLPIVHVREDLSPDSQDAQQLALEDNRIAELSLDWSPEVLSKITEDFPEVISADLGLFLDNELDTTIESAYMKAGIEFDESSSFGNQNSQILIKLRITSSDQIEDILSGIRNMLAENDFDAEIL